MKNSKLIIKTETEEIQYDIYIPENDKEYCNGLLNFELLANKTGMLFDFSKQNHAVMTMQNMKIPLDFIFIDKNGRIVKIDHSVQSGNNFPCCDAVYAVLEVNSGDCKKYNISVLDYAIYALFKNSSFNKSSETNIEFKYTLKGVGWANAYLKIGNREISFPAISYLCYPIYGILEALLHITPGYAQSVIYAYESNIPIYNRVSSCNWEDEPGGYAWGFDFIDKNRIIIKIISLYKENKQIELEKVVNFKEFLKAVLKAFDKIIKDYGFITAKANWAQDGRNFPISEFLQLKYYLFYDMPLNYFCEGKTPDWSLKNEIELLNKEID
ncbi:DUF192 domain-containing protein [Endomicrobium proavitum]|uniref:Uncharacterized protein n=1 Tax=Endomicrobium proavitum TaxID=1408281 RepID=A0A0G3WIK7_9BACT|nr:DUF192 domain-containing protein [Endomicrobium proavitum]AKL98471.1 hypothetical protein Epro_1092 [Endomicrobium proavitum]